MTEGGHYYWEVKIEKDPSAGRKFMVGAVRPAWTTTRNTTTSHAFRLCFRSRSRVMGRHANL